MSVTEPIECFFRDLETLNIENFIKIRVAHYRKPFLKKRLCTAT